MRVIRTLTISLSVLLLAAIGSHAQTRILSGHVLDNDSQPIVGAALMLPDGKGAVTDGSGSYILSVPNEPVNMEVSCLGYVSKTVRVPETRAELTVYLEEDAMTLDETVVVGYGVQKKVNLTGAITTVASKELTNRTTHNLTDMLQGAVPGLNITTSSGNPGSVGSINIRGVTSINDADPLVLIDGAVGELSRVNTNDVESISVIKDASAAAVYGARAAYGVILVTTKSGGNKDGKATVRYSGRWGWEEPTTSTHYENRGYWSVYTVDTFWMADSGSKYTTYTDSDMTELLARVNDKTENPDRPWVVEEVRGGKNQWVYYANTDWYHEMFRDKHPVQQQSISISGGDKKFKYLLSTSYDRETGIIKANPDVFQKYNMRAKFEFQVNKYMRMSNNTSYYSSTYSYLGNGSVQDTFQYASRHALASFPYKNPDGSWIYATPMISGSYNVANGRHIMYEEGGHTNKERRTDFTNTTQLIITPVQTVSVTADFTYRQYQNRDTHRTVAIGPYHEYPDSEDTYYTTGAGLDELTEETITRTYMAANFYATYKETFNEKHNVTVMAGMNMEDWNRKDVTAVGQNLLSATLSDLDLVAPDEDGETITSVSGGQYSYSLMGFFGRINYDYDGKYLFEVSGRYDGSSRFAEGHRWGFFPSASAGWRISEEKFFKPLKDKVDNLKIRFSFGSLGNQNVDYYSYLQTVSVSSFSAYSFGEGSSMAQYSSLSDPVAGDLTWETTYQYNLGLDLDMFGNRLNFSAEGYIRDTKNMLTEGSSLPAVYGADEPTMNAADLRTKGYEFSLSWRDHFNILGKPFNYNVKATLSDFKSTITKFDNPTKLLSDYYEGQTLGEIWGFVVDGLFESDEEAQYYTTYVLDCSYINSRMTGGWLGGDLRYVDLDGDGVLSTGSGTVDDPGDRKILGNSLPSMQYGFTLGFDYMGLDVSAFFQGVGTYQWYPAGGNYAFWGAYSYSYCSFLPYDFMDKVWTEENTDTYFPRARAYSSTGGELSKTNSRYIQNIRYLRFKNLTVGYTIPQLFTRKFGVDSIRFYFTAENLCYWSPLKKVTKYLDPESAYSRSSVASNHMAYPWAKSFMFGVDVTF